MGRVQVKKETVFINDIPVDKAMLTGTPGLGRRHLWNKKIALT